MRRATRAWLALSAALPPLALLTGPNTALLIYTIYVIALLNRNRIARRLERVKLPPWLAFDSCVLLSGWLAECLAWLSNYLMRAEHPALLHPQLVADLMLAVGFYGGWALAWLIVLRRWRFTLGQVFVTTGVMGVFVEQNGAIIRLVIASLTSNPVYAILLALDIFLVYGSIMGLAYLGMEKSLARADQRNGWLKFPAVIALMFLASALGVALVVSLTTRLGILPSPRPIWQYPLY